MIYFNSHAHVERDLTSQIATWSASSISTHTLTWSVTGLSRKRVMAMFYFNSHAHVERDSRLTAIDELKDISTHTLTWSVTKVQKELKSNQKFQLTRSRGA